jgi:hypothetical protein
MTGLEFEFAQHALDMILERKIGVKWIYEVLANPEFKEPDKEDKAVERVIGKMAGKNGRYSRAVIARETSPERITGLCV